jgi:hypothetical protein
MLKFLLNPLLQISKALVNSKIQFLIHKFFSLLSAQPTPWPVQPLAQPAHRPCRHRRPKSSRPAYPARASVASSRKIRFPFRIMPSRAGRLSLVSLSTGLHLSDSPPSSRHRSPMPLPRASDAPSFYSPPSSLSPLNPLQTEP